MPLTQAVGRHAYRGGRRLERIAFVGHQTHGVAFERIAKTSTARLHRSLIRWKRRDPALRLDIVGLLAPAIFPSSWDRPLCQGKVDQGGLTTLRTTGRFEFTWSADQKFLGKR